MALALVALGCRERAAERPAWRPAPVRAVSERSCDDLGDAGAAAPSEISLRLDGERVAVADPSVLGGPFAPAVSVALPRGEHAVRVYLGKTRLGEGRPVCARLVVAARGAPLRWETLGKVAVDTEAVVFADDRRWIPAARGLGAVTVGVLEGDASEFDAALPRLAAAGLEFSRLLPTFARAARPARSGDRALVRAALREGAAKLHYAEEPASAGWTALEAIAERPFGGVDLPAATRVGVAIESGEGDGTYAVRAGRDASGEIAAVDLLLSP